jgi:hypothetical protein
MFGLRIGTSLLDDATWNELNTLLVCLLRQHVPGPIHFLRTEAFDFIGGKYGCTCPHCCLYSNSLIMTASLGYQRASIHIETDRRLYNTSYPSDTDFLSSWRNSLLRARSLN